MFTVRRLSTSEFPKYRAHLKALDAESKHLRFGFNIKDDSIDRLCDSFEKNPSQHVLFVIESFSLDIIATGHVALEENNQMELAFSVLKDFQGRGLGQKLMKKCIQYCRANNLLNGHMVCLSHNKTIKHMCIKNNIKLSSEQGETVGKIQLPSPTLDTFIHEVMDAYIAFCDYISKRLNNSFTLELSRLRGV